VTLPDVNVLVAATVVAHVHHGRATAWIDRCPRFATCPITELGLLRVLMQLGASPSDAHSALESTVRRHRARLVPANVSATRLRGLVEGHRHTTDAYLAELARAHGLTLVTLDAVLVRRFPRVTELIG
jgi:toxin-antitoxin system PIN domain toxin